MKKKKIINPNIIPVFKIKHIINHLIKNKGSPITFIFLKKTIFGYMKFHIKRKEGGILYNYQLRLILGIYRKLK